MRFAEATALLILATTAKASITPTVGRSSYVINENNVAVNSSRTTKSLIGSSSTSAGLFGVVANKNSQNYDAIFAVPRGGASESDEEGEKNGEEGEEAPEVLYLPGLLEASVGKKTVRALIHFF